MKKSLKLWQIVGFVFTGIWGVVLHFLYDWTNKSLIAAPFSAVNESVWEHMKLLFLPMFVFALIEYGFIGRDNKNFWCVKLWGAIIGLLFIPIVYYGYTGIFGVNADWLNIVIFFVAAAISYFLENVLYKNRTVCSSQNVAFLILCTIALLFIILTFVQPRIPLFQDPATGGYGI
ncbi:MAG: hypothetical protein IJB16_05030 [Clostridia bacterium]|nr:hypothetical protein [Clostridia bacterium]